MLTAALRRASGRIARPIIRNASTKIVPVEAEVSMAYGTRLSFFSNFLKMLLQMLSWLPSTPGSSPTTRDELSAEAMRQWITRCVLLVDSKS